MIEESRDNNGAALEEDTAVIGDPATDETQADAKDNG
jgi:hypothetical protein